jgi:hypothetical protein
MKNGLGDLAPCGPGQLAATVRHRLKRIQYRPALIDGLLAQTGLTLEHRGDRLRRQTPDLSSSVALPLLGFAAG